MVADLVSDIFYKAVSPTRYIGLRGKTFGESAKYLFGLLCLIGVSSGVTAALNMTQALPDVRAIIAKVEAKLPELYPEGLVLAVKDGHLSINQAQPYYIEMPSSLKADLESEKNQNHEIPEYLLAVDTRASSDDYAKYKSLILLTDSAAVLPDKNDTLKVVPFSNFKQDFEISKASYLGFVDKITPYISYAIPVYKLLIAGMLFLLPLLYGAGAFIGYLVYLLIPSVIFLIVARMLGTGMQYAEVYCLSMYGLTLPLILDIFLNISAVKFGFFAVLLLFMTLVLVKLGRTEIQPS